MFVLEVKEEVVKVEKENVNMEGTGVNDVALGKRRRMKGKGELNGEESDGSD
jgi:hypothetical protein